MLHYCKGGRSTHLCRAFLTTLCRCLMCAGGSLCGGTALWQQQVQPNESRVNLAEPGGEMPHRHLSRSIISQMLDTKTWRQWSLLMWSAMNALSIRKGMDWTVHGDKRSFGTCCQAEHIKASCSGCGVCCVFLQQTKPLQRESNQAETTVSSRPWLGCFTSEYDCCFTYFQTNLAKEGETSWIAPGVKAAKNTFFLCCLARLHEKIIMIPVVYL